MTRPDPQNRPETHLITKGPRVRKPLCFEAMLRWDARAFTVCNHVYMPTLYDALVPGQENPSHRHPHTVKR